MPVWLMPFLALAVSALVTFAWMRHARRLRVMDAPERRRLHALPTPRGGGIGPVVAMLLIGALWPQPLAAFVWPIGLGLVAVAVISWIDDHRPLTVRTRLLVHLFAAMILAATFIVLSAWPAQFWIPAGLLLVAAIVAAINLHNFMDGSDAHLASQTVFVFGVLSALAAGHDDPHMAWLWAACALAGAAFLPFNWPPARVFLGDVGSISFGFLIAAFSLLAVQRGWIGWGGAMILSSAFMIDALATLCGRMRRTRHWLQPHRDHLYQWLRRRGWGAARVVAAYQAWNLLIVLPVLWFLDAREHAAALEFALTLAVYALGLGLWRVARGALRRQHRAQ